MPKEINKSKSDKILKNVFVWGIVFSSEDFTEQKRILELIKKRIRNFVKKIVTSQKTF
jgi:hypothetical protein